MRVVALSLLLVSLSSQAVERVSRTNQDPIDVATSIEGVINFGAEVNSLNIADIQPQKCGQSPEFNIEAGADPRSVDIELEENGLELSAFMKLSFGNSFEPVFRDALAKPQEYSELGSELDQLISREFESHEDRMAAMAELCQGLSETQRIYLVSNLGQRLAGIYDYGRAGGQGSSGTVVNPDMQWNAMRNSLAGDPTAAGVCRDAVSTSAEFASQCGFDKSQIRIKGYRTLGGGHQIVRIVGENGEVYNLNWSELYSSDGEAGLTETLLAGNTMGGVTVRTYNADGELLDQELTEIANVAISAAGGALSPEDQRDYNELQINLGRSIRLRGIMGNTRLGEEFKTGGISYVNESEGTLMDSQVVVGMSFTRNERQIAQTSLGESIALQQNIVFFGGGADLQSREFPIIEMDGSRVSLRGRASFDIGMFYMINKISNSDQSNNNIDQYVASEIGGEIVYKNENGVRVAVGGEIDNTFSAYYNRETGESGERGTFGRLGGFTPVVTGGRVYANVQANLSNRVQIVVDPYYVAARTGESTAGVRAGLRDEEAGRSIYGTYRISRDPIGGDLTMENYRLELNQSFDLKINEDRRSRIDAGLYIAEDRSALRTNRHGGITLTVR